MGGSDGGSGTGRAASPSRHLAALCGSALAWLVLAVLLAGCQLRLGSDVTVELDGSGRLQTVVALDRELAGRIEEAGVDLPAALAGVGETDGWHVGTSRPDGALRVSLATSFADPDGLRRRVRELQAGLPAEAPPVLEDVRLEVSEDGSARLTARAGLRLPDAANPSGVVFDRQALRRLLDESGDRLARVELRVTMPGPVATTDADLGERRTATWRLPVGRLRRVSVASDPPGTAQRLVRSPALPAAVGAGAALVAGAVTLAVRRRSARGPPPPSPPASP